jgi:hypothetical protein
MHVSDDCGNVGSNTVFFCGWTGKVTSFLPYPHDYQVGDGSLRNAEEFMPDDMVLHLTEL